MFSQCARGLRKNLTAAERKLWPGLRLRRIEADEFSANNLYGDYP